MLLLRLLVLLMAVALLQACGATPPQACPATPPVPAGTARTTTTLPGAGNTPLFLQTWRPAEGQPVRASLVVVHGLKDHGDHYAALAADLAGKGWAVHALDLRGHGRSGGERVRVEQFDEFLGDVDLVVQRARSEAPGRPLFLFGHSMGGAITTLYVLEKKPDLQGLVLSAPALKPGSDVSGFLIGVTKLLGGLFPGMGVLDLKDEQFSRDPKVVQAMGCDPLIHHEAGPARTAAELLRALERIGGRMEEVGVPFLALHGTQDKLTNPDGSRDLTRRAKATDKTLKIYEGLWHDLLHEPEHATVQADVVGWLEARAVTPTTAP